MTKAGWVLIIAGLVWIFAKSAIDYWIALKPKQQTVEDARRAVSPMNVGLPSLGEVAELLKTPHGTGVALVIVGAVLLLAGSGVSVSFSGGASPSPSPSPTL